MKIDLGGESKIEVIFSGKTYLLRSPTAKDVVGFQKKVKGSAEDDQITHFNDFLEVLGLPSEVCSSLDLTQIKKLSDGIMGVFSEKK